MIVARHRQQVTQLLPAVMLFASLVLGAPSVTATTPNATAATAATETSLLAVSDDTDDVDARRCVWTGYRWRCWRR